MSIGYLEHFARVQQEASLHGGGSYLAVLEEMPPKQYRHMQEKTHIRKTIPKIRNRFFHQKPHDPKNKKVLFTYGCREGLGESVFRASGMGMYTLP